MSEWRHLIGHAGAIHLETNEPIENDASHRYVVTEVAPQVPHYEVDDVHIPIGQTVGNFRVRVGDKE